MRIPKPIVVMNRVLLDSGLAASDLDAVAPGALFDAAKHQIAMEEEQAHWMASLDVDRVLPYLRGVLTPGEVALQLADDLDAR